MHAILVVAPDSAFRLSLRFMLESEGYEVEVLAALTDVGAFRSRADCIVVDHEILQRAKAPVASLLDDGGRVVLLTDRADAVPLAPHLRTVEKPLLGSAVLQAVRDLLDGAST